MNAFMKFNRGVLRLPVHWRLWVLLLAFFNMMVPLFFFARLEARVVLGVFLASAMLMMVLTAISGFTRLLGLGHVLWLPLLYFLWTRLDQIPAGDVFGLWIRGLMVLNAVSLVIDTTDVMRYLAGERREVIEGL